MPRSKIEYFILILGIIGIILAIISGALTLALATALITLIALNRSEARYLAFITYAVYLVTNFQSISFISIIFWFYICLQMYQNWDTYTKRVSFIRLESYMINHYANIFLVLVGLNLVMYFIFSGFNLSAVFSIPVLFDVLSGSLQFLGIYLIALCIREGALFYLGYLILKIMMLMFLMLATASAIGEMMLIVLVIQALLVYSLYQYNSK